MASIPFGSASGEEKIPTSFSRAAGGGGQVAAAIRALAAVPAISNVSFTARPARGGSNVSNLRAAVSPFTVKCRRYRKVDDDASTVAISMNAVILVLSTLRELYLRILQEEVGQEADCEATVKVTIANPWNSRGALWTPRFPKAKELSWWLILGTEDGELLALKRVRLLALCFVVLNSRVSPPCLWFRLHCSRVRYSQRLSETASLGTGMPSAWAHLVVD